AWIPWLWPVFNQIFLMIFLSIWLRRSNVTTGAEWIGTRFGFKRGANMSHTIVVVFAIIMGLGYLAYGFIGIGKFVEIFIPWEVVSPYVPFTVQPEYVPHFYGIIFTCFAVFYSLLGGMMSIVWADLIQYILMTISAIVIGIIAMQAVSTHHLQVPDGWMTPFFGSHLDLDWGALISDVNAKIASDGYSLFGIFFMMMIFKGVLVSLAGPAPNYDMQKILSTKSPREAALMSGSVSLILMPVRYFMIAGFGVLAIIYYDRLDLVIGGQIDFEQILPSAINEFVPIGLLGLLLAGLLAAFMSTFAGTLNAVQAYIVNDIYLKHINPEADNTKVKSINYLAGLTMVIISIIFGFYARDVNDVLQWIVSGLYGSYVAANILKWYWWRFNGHGFFWGMVGGLVPALSFRFIFSGVLDLYTFPLMLLLAAIGCIIGTYTAPPVDEAILKKFYKNVKPWGFWGPIREKVIAEDPDFVPNNDFGRDMFNVFIGTIWQTALVIFPIYLVLLQTVPTLITIGIAVLCTLILKKTWFDRLPA
ncbi:MAG: sodium:solute symporter, partial [Saprospiraceae bacterium]|nr:sodium:solute symporter [Saprospiraceae bacterium]